ncbi:hypothetical protein EXIGLDRAFT_693315 [Exidia glandulosa HHB12029]|uniref:Ubiquitin-like protease family profile domain-containing protein n=1 Tax=Exidia glandulosa HHB12029 TaxID=1314781 RepID=A0A165HDH8_EXIGL|nr:hypothetical protein EXIGLDRAFT_693315 [Exidia glandulosa HHB12029]
MPGCFDDDDMPELFPDDSPDFHRPDRQDDRLRARFAPPPPYDCDVPPSYPDPPLYEDLRALQGGSSGSGFSTHRTPVWDELLISSRDWLNSLRSNSTGRTATLASQCLDRIGQLPPDELLDCFSSQSALTTTLCLELLGDHWLRDEHILAGLEFVEQRLGPESRTVFMPPWHMLNLSMYRQRAAGPYNPSRPRLREPAIASGHADIVVLPALVHGNHWVIFYVDTRAATIRYADSLSPCGAPDAAMLSDLRWWLAGLLPDRNFNVVEHTSPRKG